MRIKKKYTKLLDLKNICRMKILSSFKVHGIKKIQQSQGRTLIF